MKRYTINDFNEQFPNEDACLEWLRRKRYPELIDCPTCKRPRRFHRVRSRKVYECDSCGFQISPTAGTILHKSRTPLKLWFYAVYLMANTRTGIAAKHLERELGVTYKTAWRMFSQIRKLMKGGSRPFEGTVESDETYFGGSRPGKRGRGAANKSVIHGIAERRGRLVAKVVPDVKARTLMSAIRTHVKPTAMIYTDELASYNNLSKTGYNHKRIRHSAKVYAMGDVHVNTIEGFWSLIKRGIDGANHSVSHKYLQTYLDSYSFRWNHRDDDQSMFVTLLNRLPQTLRAA